MVEVNKVASTPPAQTSRAISSESLFAGARELVIQHAGENYRLRITNQGKLILTK